MHSLKKLKGLSYALCIILLIVALAGGPSFFFKFYSAPNSNFSSSTELSESLSLALSLYNSWHGSLALALCFWLLDGYILH